MFCTQLVIPHFNGGRQPFYLEYFYGAYGGSMPEIATTMLRHPDRVVSDATQPDRIRFYRDLLLPFGGLPLAAPLELLMALPQLLASVIGSSPYARTIRYQYTSVMIAPIVIAAIEGARRLWRYRVVQRFLIPWVLVWAYVTNVAWSPSPLGNEYTSWVRDNPRRASLRGGRRPGPRRRVGDGDVLAAARTWPTASRSTTGRTRSCRRTGATTTRCRLPDPSTIDYLVVDRNSVGADQQEMFADLVDGEPYEIVFDRDDVVVARRVDAGG